MIYEDLKGKKVLVTGSSSGIGQETAKMFAQQGCFVGVHYFRTKQGGEKTFAEVKEISDYISPIYGGKGAVRDVIEQVMKVQGTWIDDDTQSI